MVYINHRQTLLILLLLFEVANYNVYSNESFSPNPDSLELKIAMLQMTSNSNQQWNLEKGTTFCKDAKNKGADIALFPELIQIGYTGIDFSQTDAAEKWKGMAIKASGEFVQHFQRLAEELDMAIVLTYMEDPQNGQLPRNTASLIDRHGKIVFSYSKVHTCDFINLENSTTPGDGFFVGDLDTKSGSVRVGMMICYDREAPESARILMLKGAEIILTPNACELDDLRIHQFQSRAFENAVATVMTNYAAKNEDDWFNGHSCIFDVDGTEVLLAGEKEGVYIGSLDLNKIRTY